ncbi:MAG: hypothetical protein CBC67_09650 [Gammaproteobacteria bacterium TMED107]|nr:DUF547 domain-containing protein [Gammaproteobacteria bacterium]OUX72536.1 MAG: hypothetical protein CBC67_09650 [Gammaproteobacteria bacterium TMED107]
MKKNQSLLLASALLCGLTTGAAETEPDFSHETWNNLLTRFVNLSADGTASRVDYEGFAESRQKLATYLNELASVSKVDFDRWSEAEQLAFLINAYNAWTVELILERYPGIESIRDIGFLPGAAWRLRIVELFGRKMSLDNLEHDMIRGWDRFHEPRIHFAVNCAAIGCPALSDRAYSGSTLNDQLDRNARQFLKDRSRNYAIRSDLYVSPIFRWYREDFQDGWGGYESLSAFLAEYGEALGLSEAQKAGLMSGRIRIRFSRYDWSLNSLDP